MGRPGDVGVSADHVRDPAENGQSGAITERSTTGPSAGTSENAGEGAYPVPGDGPSRTEDPVDGSLSAPSPGRTTGLDPKIARPPADGAATVGPLIEVWGERPGRPDEVLGSSGDSDRRSVDALGPQSAGGPPVAAAHLSSRRQHPSWILLQLIRSVRGFLVPLAVVLISGRGNGDSPFLAIAGIGATLGLATTVARWWAFRYEVIAGELRVHSGVVSRQERSVPLERVQAVDTGESPLQRVLGVVRVKVETAAGGAAGSDVTFESLTRAEATRLASLLRPASVSGQHESGVHGGEADLRMGPAGTVVRALSTRDLLVAGATSGRIGPALAIVAGGLQLVDDVLPEDVYQRFSGVVMDVSVRGIVVGGVVVGLLAWLFAIVTTVLTFGGFTLRRDGDNLLTSAGLLDRRQTTIPLRRIQALTITEGLLRQPFGLVALRVESAGYGTDAPETGILFPLLRRDQAEGLLRQVVPELALSLDALDGRLNRLPAISRRRYALGPAFDLLPLTAFAVVIAAIVPFLDWWAGLAVLALAPVAIGLGLWRFADAGWSLDEQGLLTVRGRGIARRTSVLPARRIQRRVLLESPLQRRAGLATFRAAVASGGSGGTVGIEHLDVNAGDALLAALRPRPTRSDPATRPAAGEHRP